MRELTPEEAVAAVMLGLRPDEAQFAFTEPADDDERIELAAEWLEANPGRWN